MAVIQTQQRYYKHNSAAGVANAAQSELTCNGGAGVVPPSRKRGRDTENEQYMLSPSSPAALMPIPGTHMHQAIAGLQLPALGAATTTAGRLAESATTSTSRRTVASGASASGALVPELELRQHGEEIDALVRAECDRLRAGLEQTRKRLCLALARAAAAAALREVETELAAARRRAAGLEELLRRAVAESQSWCVLARSDGAVAAELQAAIDAVLLQGAGTGITTTARPAAVEGFGDSGGTDDDAQSCCCAEAVDAASATASSLSSSWNGKWACGDGEASVLVLPCRHLCLCKACERRTDACPVWSGDKNTSIHIAPN